MPTAPIGEVDRLRSQVAALEQLLFVYEAAAVEQSDRLEQALADLHRLREHLESEVEQRTAQLTRAIEDLKEEVAERRKAEETLRESEGRFRSVAETASDAIICANGSGAFLFWNRAAERIFGYAAEEIVGQPVVALIPKRFRDSHQNHWAALESFGPASVVGKTLTVIGCRKDGSEFPAELSVGAFMTGDGAVFAGIVRDITERKRAEEFRDEYLSLVAHDLRNPLTTILGRAGVLSERLASAGLEGEADSAAAIRRNAQRINAMLEDLLESVRLESGQLVLHRAPISLDRLVRDVVARVGTPADRERIRVEVRGSAVPASADAERIERALVNLLTNALKFSPPETPVTVTVGQEEDEAFLSVADRGVGIPPEDLPHLFQRFRTVKGAEKESLGLGLYITRLIAEAHGGRVSVESQPGRGSTFRLTVPLQAS